MLEEAAAVGKGGPVVGGLLAANPYRHVERHERGVSSLMFPKSCGVKNAVNVQSSLEKSTIERTGMKGCLFLFFLQPTVVQKNF